MNQKTEFKDIREWGNIRGLGTSSKEMQYMRFLQEATEIYEAMVNDDMYEFKDAIGDTIVTLVMLADTEDIKAEDCLDQAFSVIKNRKGLNKNGSFVRYMKLNQEDKDICDQKQGNPEEEYFLPEVLSKLSPPDFEK